MSPMLKGNIGCSLFSSGNFCRLENISWKDLAIKNIRTVAMMSRNENKTKYPDDPNSEQGAYSERTHGGFLIIIICIFYVLTVSSYHHMF